jgi:hypothetical protein
MLGGTELRGAKKTRILIDSSSEAGPGMLPETNEWISLEGILGRRQYAHGISSYERIAKSGVKRSTPIGPGMAMRKCLKEAAKDTALVCLFGNIIPSN